MAKQIMKRLHIQDHNIIYDFELRSEITLIIESTGKSLFCKTMQRCMEAGIIKNAHVVNAESSTSEVEQALFKSRDSLIIMDDADKTLAYFLWPIELPSMDITNQLILVSETSLFYPRLFVKQATMKATTRPDGRIVYNLEYLEDSTDF